MSRTPSVKKTKTPTPPSPLVESVLNVHIDDAGLRTPLTPKSAKTPVVTDLDNEEEKFHLGLPLSADAERDYERERRRRPSDDHHHVSRLRLDPLDSYLRPDSSIDTMKSKALGAFYRRQNNVISLFKQINILLKNNQTDGAVDNKDEARESLISDNSNKGSDLEESKKKAEEEVEDDKSSAAEKIRAEKRIMFALQLSFYGTFLLLGLKGFAAFFSLSIALISVCIDSVLDLASQGVLLFATAEMKRRDTYKYPSGKGRMQPLGLVVFCCIMAMAGVQLFIEAVQQLAAGPDNASGRVNAYPLAAVGVVILIQFGEFLYCRHVAIECASSPEVSSVEAIAGDHINDVVISIIGTVPAAIASYFPSVWFLDDIGGMLLSIYITTRWAITCRGQFGALLGTAAPPEFISQVTYLASMHDPERIRKVDTVIAYHFGAKYQVECHIVVDGLMILKEAHDIGEALEKKIEELENVEMAFVHLDYEWSHNPEHKVRTSG